MYINSIIIEFLMKNNKLIVSKNMTYNLYFDGASRGNPGPSSWGISITRYDGCEIYKNCGMIDNSKDHTNNYAEYYALYMGLLSVKKLGIRSLSVFGDSMLVIKQLSGLWKLKSKSLKFIHGKIKDLISESDMKIQSYNFIRRSFNSRADQLANEAFL